MSLIKITNDMFNIAKRIRAIDPYYYVVYDTKAQVYQLHHSKQKYSAFCLTLGKTLDKRAVQKTLKTKQGNFDKIFKQIELDNYLIKTKSTQLIIDKATAKLKNYTDYLNYSTKTINFDQVD